MQNERKENMTPRATPMFLSDVEDVLLSHVEMCYSVALALTRDPARGQRLARETLLWAWRQQATTGSLGGGKDIKMALLSDLRGRFLSDYSAACPRDPGRFRPEHALAPVGAETGVEV